MIDMEELETLYKPIPAYSTNEYKVAGRNLHIDKTEAFEKISRRVKAMNHMEMFNFVSGLVNVAISSSEETKGIFDGCICIPENLPLGDIIFTAQDTENLLSGLATEFNRKEIECMDISKIKKQIKHCKNQLKRKALERQLNKVYKARKAKNAYQNTRQKNVDRHNWKTYYC